VLHVQFTPGAHYKPPFRGSDMPLTGPSAPLEAVLDRSARAERLVPETARQFPERFVPETARRRRCGSPEPQGGLDKTSPSALESTRVALMKDDDHLCGGGRSAGPPSLAFGASRTTLRGAANHPRRAPDDRLLPSSYLRAGLRAIVEQAPAALPGSGNSDPQMWPRTVSRDSRALSKGPAVRLNDPQTIPGRAARTTRLYGQREALSGDSRQPPLSTAPQRHARIPRRTPRRPLQQVRR
jgi:hypothetical protein